MSAFYLSILSYGSRIVPISHVDNLFYSMAQAIPQNKQKKPRLIGTAFNSMVPPTRIELVFPP